MYFQPETGRRFGAHSEIRAALPNVMFGETITDEDLALPGIGIFPLLSDRPELDAGQVAEPAGIEQIDGVWTQLWVTRAATPEEMAERLAQEEAQRPKRHMTVLAFRNRFTRAEKLRVELAAIDDPAADQVQRERAALVRIGQADLAAATYVDVDRADTRADVQAFEAMGLLDAPGRALAILDDPIQAHERYNG